MVAVAQDAPVLQSVTRIPKTVSATMSAVGSTMRLVVPGMSILSSGPEYTDEGEVMRTAAQRTTPRRMIHCLVRRMDADRRTRVTWRVDLRQVQYAHESGGNVVELCTRELCPTISSKVCPLFVPSSYTQPFNLGTALRTL